MPIGILYDNLLRENDMKNHPSHFNEEHAEILFMVREMLTRHVEMFTKKHDLAVLPTMNHVLESLIINCLRPVIQGYQQASNDADEVAQDAYKQCAVSISKVILDPMVIASITCNEAETEH